jgi:hypothetical protein
MPLGHIGRTGSGTGCGVAMGSISSGVYIGSFLFAPKRPHVHGSVSNADEVHPPSHVFPLALMAAAQW